MKNGEKPLTRREMREKILEKRAQEQASFRRGKTISEHQKENSARIKDRKLVIRRRKLGLFFASIIFVVILSLLFLLQFVAKPQVVFENVQKKNNSEKYTASIEKFLNLNPTNRILSSLNKSELLGFLRAESPEILDISKIEMSNLGTFNFYLTFRKPVASWVVDGKTVYVDAEGVAFQNNFFEEPNLSIVDDSGAIVSSGKTVASGSFLKFIGKLVSSAQAKGVNIVKIRIPPLSLRGVEVHVEGISYYAKMLTTESAEGQITNFKSSIDFFAKNNLSPTYVDLRVEGRGYYK